MGQALYRISQDFVAYLHNMKINNGTTLTLTLSSTTSMEKSLPSPRELLHVRMVLLLVTRARMVHLSPGDEAEVILVAVAHLQSTSWTQNLNLPICTRSFIHSLIYSLTQPFNNLPPSGPLDERQRVRITLSLRH